MADYTGGAAAYQQLRPIEDKTLDNLYKLDRMLAERDKRRLAKEKLDADARAKKEQALRKSIKDSGALDPIEMPISKVSDLNQLNLMAVNDATHKVKDIVDLMEKGQINEYDAKFKINNLKQIPRKLQAAQQKFEQEYLRAKELRDSGMMSAWDADRFDQMEAFVVQEDPETGQPIYNFRYQTDNNGNLYGIGKTAKGEVAFSSVDDFLAGRSDLFNFTPEADYDVTVSDTVKDLGKVKLTGLEGPYKVSEQTFETVNPETGYSNRDVVVGKAEVLFGNEDNPSPLAKRYWSDILRRNPSDLDEEGMQEMKDNFVEDVGAKYGFERSKVLDPTFESRQKRFSKERKDDEVPFLEIARDQQGKPILQDIPGEAADIEGEGYAISLPKKDDKGRIREIQFEYGGKEYTIDNMYLTEVGELVFTGYTKERVKNTYDEYEYVKKPFTKGGLSKDDLIVFNDVARFLPANPKTGKEFKDAYELRKYMMEEVGIPIKESKTVKKESKTVKIDINKKGSEFKGKELSKEDIKGLMQDFGIDEIEARTLVKNRGGSFK
jgi:hypothetical protein